MQTDNGLRKGSEHADAQYSLFFNANIGKISAFAVILQYFRQRVASEMVQNNSKNKTVMTV